LSLLFFLKKSPKNPTEMLENVPTALNKR